MASIDSLTFSITRTSFPDGHVCSIEYSYYLHIDPEQYRHEDVFSMSAELHGDDVFYDKTIGKPVYDTHVISRSDVMPQRRSFTVPCEVLDEAWGEDRVYLKLYVASSDGEMLTAKSAIIHEWF
jgi:hypothetical protein